MRKPSVIGEPFRMRIRCTLGYSFYLISNALFIIVLPPVMAFLFWSPGLQHSVAQSTYRIYCFFLTRVYLPALGVYSISEQSGFEQTGPSTPAIFIANHRSRLDGPFITPLLPNTGVVIKSSYAKMPFYMYLVKYVDFVSVNPHSIESLSLAMRRCKEFLYRGKRLLIFPEGTRASSARVKAFKDLAFRLSIECGIPVTPVIIHTDRPLMAKIKGSLFPEKKIFLTIRALPPQSHLQNERPADFAARIRRLMVNVIRGLDENTEWEKYYHEGAQDTLKQAAPSSRRTSHTVTPLPPEKVRHG